MAPLRSMVDAPTCPAPHPSSQPDRAGAGRQRASLSLPLEEMRRLGYRMVDMIVDHVETLLERPVSTVASRVELEGA